MPMLVGTTLGLINVRVSLLIGPETRGRDFQSDLTLH